MNQPSGCRKNDIILQFSLELIRTPSFFSFLRGR